MPPVSPKPSPELEALPLFTRRGARVAFLFCVSALSVSVGVVMGLGRTMRSKLQE
jgi:hypothetical protein